MSKITELRRKATEASRSRKWDAAVKLYDRICDLDGANPGYRNELGDVFAKKGDIPSALANFDKAVGLYNAVGLSNNAVAVLKKILRYDPQNMDSHWLLGETRRKQGLDTDATSHYLAFLDSFSEVSDGTRERFLDRCSMLLEDIPLDLDILGKLDGIFESWEMGSERARVMICKAKLARESGEEDLVQRYIERAQTLTTDVSLFPEYGELFGSGASGTGQVPVVEIDESGASSSVEVKKTHELDLDFDLPTPSGQTAGPGPGDSPDSAKKHDEEPDSGFGEFKDLCDTITDDDASHAVNLEDLKSRFSSGDPDSASLAPSVGDEAKADEAVDPIGGVIESVNLLEEILADGGLDSQADDASQVETIGRDIGTQMGGDVNPEDYDGHYDLGLVYMDMGMYEQGLPSFERAAMGEETRLKALEMAGNCLRKLERNEEALESYRKGLAVTGLPPRQYLGLLYEVAACLEALERYDEALESYERVAYLDEHFLDVTQRLDELRQRS